MDEVVKRLREISIAPPREGGGFDVWLEQEDFFAFLNDNLSNREFVLYASLPFTFIYAIAVPIDSLKPLEIEDLMAWGANPWSSWGISTSLGESAEIDITPPLQSVGSKVLAGGEQLIYGRRFDGRQEQQSYYEVLQKLTHLLDLHYVPERRSYCKFDKRGDVDDVIRFIDIPREGGNSGGTIVTMAREILDEYLTLTKAAIVRVFDVTRYEPTKFGGWRNARTEVFIEDGDLYYRRAVEAGYASYARGFQIARSNFGKQDLRARMQGEHARQLMEPLHDVHNLRSELKGHATGDGARKVRASAISEHGSYRRHFEALCARCDESMRQISKALGASLHD